MLLATRGPVKAAQGVERPSRLRQALEPPTHDALVLDAGLRQSLVTVRSLGRRGLAVAALASSGNTASAGRPPAFSSRWCRQRYLAPPYDHGTGPYLAYLEALLDGAGVRVLIASSDGTVALLRRHRERLEGRVRVALAKEPALAIASNKDLTLEIARHLGIGVPRGVGVCSVNDVAAAVREVGLPAVVKPVESWVWAEQGGERLVCRLVTTPDEARRAVAELTRQGGATLFQQWLPGRREAVSVMYADGHVHARFAQWAKRTQPPLGGTSVLRQSIAVPEDIGEQTVRLVRAIDLEGYSEVEFRRDGAGAPHLMEINARLSASVEVAVRAGVDFPALLYQWACGGPIDEVKAYRVGNWMRYLEGDLVATVAALRQRGRPGVAPPVPAIAGFLFSFFKPMGYDYLDWKDPLPAYVAALNFVQSRFSGR